MKYIDIIGLAFKNAFRGKVKTFLCALSVCVGIFSVCTISGLGIGAQKLISSEIEQTGLGGIAIYPENSNSVIDVSCEQLSNLIDMLPEIKDAMPMSLHWGYSSFKNRTVYTAVCGINQALDDVFNIELLYGRLPSAFDINASGFVAVIDDVTAEKLYLRKNPIGKNIEIGINGNKEQFKIIGVVKSQTQLISGFVGDKTPQIAYVPYSTVNQISGSNTVDKIIISCFAGANETKTAEIAMQRLKVMNNGVNFKYENMGMYTQSLKNVVNVIALFISAVAGISIFVGGIGVMNSMISAVEHRTKEIGIYLALGATKRDILRYFLYEAVIICLLGGITGGVISYIIMLLSQHLLAIPIEGTVETVLLSICGAAACGVIFGVAPAIKAANLNPIDAIGKNG